MQKKGKSININIVAEKAGVSPASVSRVVNNRTDISEKLRRKVQAVIDELNFVPNKGEERVFNVGVILPSMSDYVCQIIGGMTDYSEQQRVDLSIIVYRGGKASRPLLQTIRERRCDAVCLINPEIIPLDIPKLEKAGLPTMLINTPTAPDSPVGFINHDGSQNEAALARLLRDSGHRRIGFLKLSPEDADNHKSRLGHYLKVMKELKVDYLDWIEPHVPTRRGQEAGYRQTISLLSRHPELTAIVCVNDEMAMGCYKACYDLGKRIPEDISVVGHDDLPFAEFMTPGLTTIKQPLAEMGYHAISHLDQYLKGKIAKLPHETLKTELIIRGSVCNKE